MRYWESGNILESVGRNTTNKQHKQTLTAAEWHINISTFAYFIQLIKHKWVCLALNLAFACM